MKHARPPSPILRPIIILPILGIALIVSLVAAPSWPAKLVGSIANYGSADTKDTRSGSSAAKSKKDDGGYYVGVTPDGEEFEKKGNRSPFSGKFAPLGSGTEDADVSGDAVTSDASATNDVQTGTTVDANPGPSSHLLPESSASTEGDSVGINSSGPYEARDALNNAVIATVAENGGSRVYYKYGVYTLATNGKTVALSAPVRFVPKPGAILSLTDYKDKNYNGRIRFNEFRGNISVRYSTASAALWAVNELSLEDYLKGISEADPKAPTEYLKVMAVVSRSYALFYIKADGKHKGEPFDLHNSRMGNGNDQVYAGYSYEKQLPTIARTVNATKGIVVTYQGKVAKTPYSAGTDGRTRSAAEVWGASNPIPFCASVSDPYGKISNWKTLPGNHMVGLSGAGARGFARAGKDYRFILDHYYTGIKVESVQAPRWIRIGIYKAS